ncbi:MAG: hypothetical protein IK083_10250 [Abditibacteriota bacterium]|nr:hypothetical protein [Abditibacteriota bacterium]
MKRCLFTVLCLLCAASCLLGDALGDYFSKAEDAFAWNEISRTEVSQALRCELGMTSLTYKNTPWKHTVSIIIPKTVTVPDTALLFAVMGDGMKELDKYAGMIASVLGCPMVIVWDVPNKQPGLSDDGAIAKTLAEAYAGGKQEDVMLLPMAKSVLKAMDICDAYLKQQGAPVSKYVIGGPSKDGWITWLAAASGDKRIAGIIPVIFDFLDMEKQLALQKEAYGRYSDMIKEYTAFEDMLTSSKGKSFMKLVDPITYAPKITVPKLLINATNDSYWNIASANLYWKSLPGDKYLVYAVNMDHGKTIDGSQIDPLRLLPIINTAAMFVEKCAGSAEMPAPTWNWTAKKGSAACVVRAPKDAVITAATVFVATGDSRDLRKSPFEPAPMSKTDSAASVNVKAEGKYKAAVCQITLTCNNKPYTVFTTPQVIEPAE